MKGSEMTTSLFDSSGRPSNELAKLLEVTGVQHDGTLEGVRDATQLAWYDGGKLRKDIQERHGRLRERVMPIMQELGYIDPVIPFGFPSRKIVAHALIQGALVSPVRRRMRFLGERMKAGVVVSNFVICGSDRKLDPAKESADVLFDGENADLPFDDRQFDRVMPKDELDMMCLVYEQTEASQWAWHTNRICQVLAEREKLGHNPNTADVVAVWLEKFKPKPGLCLVISNQPYVRYQGMAVRSVLPPEFQVEAVGPGASPNLPVSTYLDNLAKEVWEIARSAA